MGEPVSGRSELARRIESAGRTDFSATSLAVPIGRSQLPNCLFPVVGPPRTRRCRMPAMNIAAALKVEIVRLARKEIRHETETLKKAAANYRADIAALKRRLLEMEKQLRHRGKAPKADDQTTDVQDGEAPKTRFSARSLAAQRKRLGLAVSDIALLVGASGQSVYNWESGQVRPRASQLMAIAALRQLGKKEAAARLEALRAAK
jgi:DNA-binding transcriptional regulator YiaG